MWELSVFIFSLFSSFCGARRRKRKTIFISEPPDKYKTGYEGSTTVDGAVNFRYYAIVLILRLAPLLLFRIYIKIPFVVI